MTYKWCGILHSIPKPYLSYEINKVHFLKIPQVIRSSTYFKMSLFHFCVSLETDIEVKAHCLHSWHSELWIQRESASSELLLWCHRSLRKSHLLLGMKFRHKSIFTTFQEKQRTMYFLNHQCFNNVLKIKTTMTGANCQWGDVQFSNRHILLLSGYWIQKTTLISPVGGALFKTYIKKHTQQQQITDTLHMPKFHTDDNIVGE